MQDEKPPKVSPVDPETAADLINRFWRILDHNVQLAAGADLLNRYAQWLFDGQQPPSYLKVIETEIRPCHNSDEDD